MGRLTSLALVLIGCGRIGFELETDSAIVDVQPRWVPPTGGEIAVTIAEPLDVVVTIDAVPCIAQTRVERTITCTAPPHEPANVPIALAGDAPWERAFTYMTGGPYQYGGAADDRTSGIAVDSHGNVYTTGATTGGLDGANAGDFDAVLVKHDASGTLQWTRQLGTPLFDYSRDVAVGESGEITIVGYTAGDLDGTSGGNDVFVARYTAAGELAWITQTGSAGDDQAWDLAVDAQGYTVVAVRTTGALGPVTPSGAFDFAIVRYTPAGTVAWIDQGGTASDDIGHSVAVAPSGVAYLVGYTAGTFDQPNAGMLDMFVARYEPEGTRTWLRQRGSAGNDQAHDAHVAADGSVWIAGRTDGALDGNVSAGGGDLFAMKYGADGAWQVTRQFGSAGNEDAFGVSTSASGVAFLSCSTSMAFDGQPYVGGTNDMCVVSLDAGGNHRWTRLFGSAGGDQTSSLTVDIGHTGLVYVSAITDGSLDAIGNRGGNDIVVAKLDDSGMLR